VVVRADVIESILTNADAKMGYRYIVETGATTMTEQWNTQDGSQNHVSPRSSHVMSHDCFPLFSVEWFGI
jgi:hypothetical protein